MDMNGMNYQHNIEPAREIESTLRDRNTAPPSCLFSSPSTGSAACHTQNKLDETPITHNNSNAAYSSLVQTLIISDLELRQPREERSRRNTRKIDVSAIKETKYDNPEAVILLSESAGHRERAGDIAQNHRRPRLRIRPKVPLPTIGVVPRVIIPSSGTENCEELAAQIASPHSDRFVLQFPSSMSAATATATGESDNHEGNDGEIPWHTEQLSRIILEPYNRSVCDITTQPKDLPFGTTTLCSNPSINDRFLFDPTTVPSPTSTSVSHSPISREIRNAANAAKKKLRLKPKRDKEEPLVGSNSPTSSSCSNTNRELDCDYFFHNNTNEAPPPPPPPPLFESEPPANCSFNTELDDDDDAVTMEESPLKPSSQFNTLPAFLMKSHDPHDNLGRIMSLKPKRPRILSDNEQKQETADNEAEDMLMDLDPNISFSRESHDNNSGLIFHSPQYQGTTTIAIMPASSPARRQAHDQGSIEMAKEAARFGSMLRKGSTSNGSITSVSDAAMSPSNMSESNFRTPIQETVPSSRGWWHMRGNSNNNLEKQGSVGLFLPSLFSNNSEDNISDNELSWSGGLTSSLSFFGLSDDKFSFNRS